jgi:hypothetical protein
MEKSDTFFDIPMIEKKIIEDSRAPTTPRIAGATDTLFLPRPRDRVEPLVARCWMRNIQIASDRDRKMSDVDASAECRPAMLRAHLGTQFLTKILT